jgi:hypothetical protein
MAEFTSVEEFSTLGIVICSGRKVEYFVNNKETSLTKGVETGFYR